MTLRLFGEPSTGDRIESFEGDPQDRELLRVSQAVNALEVIP
jgi:hypothetical protein